MEELRARIHEFMERQNSLTELEQIQERYMLLCECLELMGEVIEAAEILLNRKRYL